jgi:alpha-L-fucosidase
MSIYALYFDLIGKNCRSFEIIAGLPIGYYKLFYRHIHVVDHSSYFSDFIVHFPNNLSHMITSSCDLLRKVIILLSFPVAMATAQSNQYVLIDTADDMQVIVHKAAKLTPSPRQLRWQQLELTAFFHYGINTYTGREWGDGKEDPKLFNPSDLDVDQWIRTVKDAGIKQVIITAKHHDGFCLWPSDVTDHSVESSPWQNGKGDVVREVANACRKHGIGFGVYLSPWDRNATMYGTEAYNDFFVAQLTELLTRYGKVDEVWFDGANGEGPNGKRQVYDFPRWYRLIRKLQPEAVIAIMGPDVRWVGTETGYGRETEWSVVPADNIDPAAVAAGSQHGLEVKPMGDMRASDLGSREKLKNAKALVWYPAETDVSIRPGWFYHAQEDNQVKSAEKLNDIYFSSVGRNGVLLLNIPPDRRGRIHASDSLRLMEWSTLRNDIFDTNLVARAASPIGRGAIRTITDPSDASDISLKPGTGEVELNFKESVSFSVLALQENIRFGQRVESFILEQQVNGGWKEIVRGTTVGYKRLVRFPLVTTARLRLRFPESRGDIRLATFGLYR